MSFVPPRCPNEDCSHHEKPAPKFWIRKGYYQPRCRSEPVPRYRCRGCRRGFSRQTFRHDYRDRKPHCNELLFRLLVSGVGLRQSGRQVGLVVQSVQGKMRKFARTCRGMHANLMHELPAGRCYLLDEEETYECTSIQPLTMPVLIERETWFVVASEVGCIRRLAVRGSARRKRQDKMERQSGRRQDQSHACVEKTLRSLSEVAKGALTLQTDQKSSYATISRTVFGDRLIHETTPGSQARTTRNPLFPINTTLAMTRDNCGRLRRKSWLVTKKAQALDAHMAIFTVYRNYVRQRFNRDQKRETPAYFLKLLPRQLDSEEVLRWRQDWGLRSSHPMSRDGLMAMA